MPFYWLCPWSSHIDFIRSLLIYLIHALMASNRAIETLHSQLISMTLGVMTTDSITGSIDIDEIIKELDTAQVR